MQKGEGFTSLTQALPINESLQEKNNIFQGRRILN